MAIVDYQQGELVDYKPTIGTSLMDCYFDYYEVEKIIMVAFMKTKIRSMPENINYFIKDYVKTYYEL